MPASWAHPRRNRLSRSPPGRMRPNRFRTKVRPMSERSVARSCVDAMTVGLGGVGVGAPAAAAVDSTDPAATPASAPNVVVVLADDLGYDPTILYGCPEAIREPSDLYRRQHDCHNRSPGGVADRRDVLTPVRWPNLAPSIVTPVAEAAPEAASPVARSDGAERASSDRLGPRVTRGG
jgi:hypothetical protein